MKVKDLIRELRKLDPDLPCVTIQGDCDEVYEAGSPEVLFVNDAEDPTTYGDKKSKHCSVKAVRI